jgi:hypothetical protein
MENGKVVAEVSDEQKQMSLTGNSPADMIRLAVSGKADIGQLKELLNLQKEYEERQALKQYALSFATAQAGIQAVVKTKPNPQTHSKYADLSDIIESAKPVYTAEGFAIIFYEGDTTLAEHVRVYADVLHREGHKETYHFDVPLDGKGIQGNANMTKIHGKSSSVSYGRRYLMCGIWNIPTQDDDGNAAGGKELINDKQLGQLVDMLADLPGVPAVNQKNFLTYMKVERIEEILKTNFQKAIVAIQSAKTKLK